MPKDERSELVERLKQYAEELIEPHDGDMGGARIRAAKAMHEAAAALEPQAGIVSEDYRRGFNEALRLAAAIGDKAALKNRETAKRNRRHPMQGLAEQDYAAMADEAEMIAHENEAYASEIRALSIAALTPSEQGSGLREALEEVRQDLHLLKSAMLRPDGDIGNRIGRIIAKIDALSIGGFERP